MTRVRPAAVVFLVAAACYLNVVPHGFVWDDHGFILGLPQIRDLVNAPSFFAENVHGLYRPVRTLVEALAWRAFGDRPLGWHVLPPLVHGAASLLLFLVAVRIAGARAALFAALLFAVHPVHTERVSHVAGAMDLVGVVLMLASLAAALRAGVGEGPDASARGRIARAPAALSLLLAALALLASEEAVLLAPVLALYRWTRARRGVTAVRGEWVFLASLAAIAAAYLALRTAVVGGAGRSAEYALGTFATTLWTMGKVFLRYIQLLILPTGLRVEYAVPPATGLDPLALAGWLAAAVIVTAAAALVRRGRSEGFALSWSVLAILPFANLLPSPELIAERYLYIPSMGFCFAAGTLLDRGTSDGGPLPPRTRGLARIAFAALLFAFAIQTVARNRDYRDDCALFAATIRETPTSSFAHNNLGACLAERGRAADALGHFRRAVALDPGNDRARYNLALELFRRREHRDAEGVLRPMACAADRSTPDARFLLGLIAGATDAPPACSWIADDARFQVGVGVSPCEDDCAWQTDALRGARASSDLEPRFRRIAEERLRVLDIPPRAH
jgi:tetratricopeptide (TPR) repeat protein